MKLYTRDSTKGFTLLELIVGGVISLTILSVSLSLINTQRRQFLSTQNRNTANSNLRASLDLIGADIKTSGERLENASSLPGIRIFEGTGVDNADDEHDRLILQKSLLTESLTVCDAVAVNDRNIVVSRTDMNGNACVFSDDDDGDPTTPDDPDALSDDLNAFRNFRCSTDGNDVCDRGTVPATIANCDDECSVAIIVDVSNPNRNELFYYAGEQCENVGGAGRSECQDRINGDTNADVQNTIAALPLEQGGGANWLNTYPPGSRIYIFEEREYRLERANDPDYDGILNLVINRQDRWKDNTIAQNEGDPIELVDQIARFDIRANRYSDTDGDAATPPVLQPFQQEFNESLVLANLVNWQDISQIEITVEADNPSRSDLIDLPRGGCVNDPEANRLCLTSSFYPRNALSRTNPNRN